MEQSQFIIYIYMYHNKVIDDLMDQLQIIAYIQSKSMK